MASSCFTDLAAFNSSVDEIEIALQQMETNDRIPETEIVPEMDAASSETPLTRTPKSSRGAYIPRRTLLQEQISDELADDTIGDVTPASTTPTPLSAVQLAELQRALIVYITQTARIFYAAEPRIWNDFYNQDAILVIVRQYSLEQLRDEFVQHVLPLIYNFNLTAQELKCINLLQLHPDYKRIAEGYILLPLKERPLNCLQPTVGTDFRLVPHAQDQAIFQTDMRELGDDHQTLVIPSAQQQGDDAEFSLTTAAVLSAVLGTDLELASSVALEPLELQERLRAAKRQFAQFAHVPENIRSSANLRLKIKRMAELRRAVANMLATKYGG